MARLPLPVCRWWLGNFCVFLEIRARANHPPQPTCPFDQMALVVGKNLLTQELADIFTQEEADGEVFHGFSDQEINYKNSDFKEEVLSDISIEEEDKSTFKPPSARSFKLRVALRSTQLSDEEERAEEEQARTTKDGGAIRKKKTSRTKKSKPVKLEVEDAALTPFEERASDPAEDASNTFLAKRDQNIKANKAMLAQLMADLQKMPGGAGFLQNQTGKLKTKDRNPRPPRRSGTGQEFRRNPERASRRQTRSMGLKEEPSAPQEDEMELSLEEELLEVRSSRRRGAPRPQQSKPHIIRPVEDIMEDELLLVADNTTEKEYNSVTGSTCHQCRQKTVDTKTCCRSDDCRGIQGQFCGPCLRNRYGEDVRKALLDPEWKCPCCRGICNCSFCRQREGRCPTGILFPLAQYHGFSDVHSYLSSLRSKLKNQEEDAEI